MYKGILKIINQINLLIPPPCGACGGGEFGTKEEDGNAIKSPIYPHTPVKVYFDAKVSKSEYTKDFKETSLIYFPPLRKLWGGKLGLYVI